MPLCTDNISFRILPEKYVYMSANSTLYIEFRLKIALEHLQNINTKKNLLYSLNSEIIGNLVLEL